MLACPEAEPAVGAQRARYDKSAQDGIPAHFTVVYPFKPTQLLTEADHATLERLFTAMPAFTIRGDATAWFGDAVMYVAPDNPAPIRQLIDTVTRAFPDFQPYNGAFDEVIPHLTVGHGQSRDLMLAAEQTVQARLPFTQNVDHVELWAGPAVADRTEPAEWHHVRSYALGIP